MGCNVEKSEENTGAREEERGEGEIGGQLKSDLADTGRRKV